MVIAACTQLTVLSLWGYSLLFLIIQPHFTLSLFLLIPPPDKNRGSQQSLSYILAVCASIDPVPLQCKGTWTNRCFVFSLLSDKNEKFKTDCRFHLSDHYLGPNTPCHVTNWTVKQFISSKKVSLITYIQYIFLFLSCPGRPIWHHNMGARRQSDFTRQELSFRRVRMVS